MLEELEGQGLGPGEVAVRAMEVLPGHLADRGLVMPAGALDGVQVRELLTFGRRVVTMDAGMQERAVGLLSDLMNTPGTGSHREWVRIVTTQLGLPAKPMESQFKGLVARARGDFGPGGLALARLGEEQRARLVPALREIMQDRATATLGEWNRALKDKLTLPALLSRGQLSRLVAVVRGRGSLDTVKHEDLSEEEWRQLVPVLRRLRQEYSDATDEALNVLLTHQQQLPHLLTRDQFSLVKEAVRHGLDSHIHVEMTDAQRRQVYYLLQDLHDRGGSLADHRAVAEYLAGHCGFAPPPVRQVRDLIGRARDAFLHSGFKSLSVEQKELVFPRLWEVLEELPQADAAIQGAALAALLGTDTPPA
ncbi:hypothetical protein ACWGI8_44505, partial [Streptomyces sp. NPDC054841]